MAGGRPSKLTIEIKKKLIQAIKAGNYYEAACAYAGIDYSTFRKWLQKGETAKSGEFFEFFEAIKKAESTAEAQMVAQWQKAMPLDWRAIATFMERRYPERWGRKEKIQQEISGRDGNPIEITNLTVEQMDARIEELLAKRDQ
jgi:hypothetical protein